MKKLLLSLALLSSVLVSAQNDQEEKYNDISFSTSAGVGLNFGISWERSTTLFNGKEEKNEDNKAPFKTSNIISLSSSQGTLSSSSFLMSDVDGSGYNFSTKSRTYFNRKAHKGFYMAGGMMFGRLVFDQENIYDTSVLGGDGKFYGKYRYLSLFNPEVGVKFEIAKTVSVDLNLGTAWLIEIEGEGDVDNHMFDNWATTGGLSIGYVF